MKAISAKLEASELKVTSEHGSRRGSPSDTLLVQRKVDTFANRSMRSAFTSYSAPARVIDPSGRI